MKKILIIANNDVGLYKFRRELIEALLEHYEVHIALPDGGFVKDLTPMGCIFHPTEFNRHGTNPVRDIVLLRKYASLVRRMAAGHCIWAAVWDVPKTACLGLRNHSIEGQVTSTFILEKSA